MFSTKMSPGGQVVIPVALRKKLGIAVGDTVVFSEGEFGPMLRPQRVAVRNLQAAATRNQRPDVEVTEVVEESLCKKPQVPKL